jgi:hypothetical protein
VTLIGKIIDDLQQCIQVRNAAEFLENIYQAVYRLIGVVLVNRADRIETLWKQRVVLRALCAPPAVGTGGSTATFGPNLRRWSCTPNVGV